jgi:pyruvate,water dikinase
MKGKSIKLWGIPASLGSGKGFIVHVKGQDDLKRVNEESIIVTDKITTEYTEGFSRCVAVIATKGGVTCHAAIVCREMGKPCIVACTEAFDILKEGDFVKVDAGSLELFSQIK